MLGGRWGGTVFVNRAALGRFSIAMTLFIYIFPTRLSVSVFIDIYIFVVLKDYYVRLNSSCYIYIEEN